jgi:hypothetical protein
MTTRFAAAAFGCASLLAVTLPARAHVVAGARVFPVTLTFDDPGVNDEASIPSFAYGRSGAEGGTGPTHEYDAGFEFDKTITPTTALIFNDGWDVFQTNGAKTQTGFENLFITGKWQAYTNAAHEFVVSLGITREIGGSGTDHTGADHYGSTSPNLYFGKGLGDLPAGVLRPFALTGELSYTIADRELKAFTPPGTAAAEDGSGAGGIAAQFNNGNNNAWAGGLSLQYSVPYLQTQVHDYGLPSFIGNLVPLVEVTWSSPASSPSSQGTTWTIAPGMIYLAQWGEVGVEALIPANKAAGTNVGAVALVHIFLDDLLPHSLGKPIFP